MSVIASRCSDLMCTWPFAALTQESIVEAVQFRQKLARIARENEAKGGWFFRPWNAREGTGRRS